MIRNQGFYDLNESRPWPLSDEASGLDDLGQLLQHDLLADLHLAFPLSAGSRAFLGAVTVTPSLVSVIVLATDDIDAPGTIVPLAAISLPKPVEAHRNYLLEPLLSGVSGWIVLGTESARAGGERVTARFTQPRQSLLLPSCAWPLPEPPIPGIGKLNVGPLSGLIRLSSGNDIEIVEECWEVPGSTGDGCSEIAEARRVIVIRLKDTSAGSGGVVVPVAGGGQSHVLQRYSGPCGRPESQTCGEPQPIETVGGVQPDCCGNITLLIRGCANLSQITEEVDAGNIKTMICGAMINCPLGLEDVCVTPDRLPDAQGRLPNEYDDLCQSISVISLSVPVPEESLQFAICQSLVAGEQVIDLTQPQDSLQRLAGHFAYMALIEDANTTFLSTEAVGGDATRNIAVVEAGGGSYHKAIVAVLEMRQGSQGSLHNASVIAGVHETEPGSRIYTYAFAEIDYDGYYQGYKLLRLGEFDGKQYRTRAAVPVPEMALEAVYELELQVYPAVLDDCQTVPGKAWLIGRLTDPADAEFEYLAGPALVSMEEGQFGLSTNRAHVRFTELRIANS